MTRPIERLVVFEIDRRSFGVALGHVCEVLRMAAVEQIPGGPAWLLGVLNLRGDTIPVVDIGARLGVRKARVHPDDRLIVVETHSGRSGGVVEAVRGSVIEPDEYIAADGSLGSDAVIAVARAGAELIPVVNPEVFWSPGEMPSGVAV